jgi:hypothetical protein
MVTIDELASLSANLKIAKLDRYQEQFAEAYKKISKAQRMLITTLVARFEAFDFGCYPSLSNDLGPIIVKEIPASIESVLFLPLLDPVKPPKTKSGHAVLYAGSRVFEKLVRASGRKFSQKDRLLPADLKKANGKSMFVLVDDFIGSGSTAVSAIKDLFKSGIGKDRIMIATFVCQEVGRAQIEAMGVRVVFLKAVAKGISDSSDFSDKSASLALMESLERSMGVDDKYRFGYMRSEALVLMCFCPNNTFPFFWFSSADWEAPFCR